MYTGIIQRRRIINAGKSMGGGVAAAAGYTGPGDITTFFAWSGLRAYNAAYAAPGNNPAIDIVDSGNANAATINILTTGALDEATLNTWIVAHGTASVKKWYDQTGSGKYWSQSTVANMPVIQQNVIGSKSGITKGASAAWLLLPGNDNGAAHSQPASYSLYAKDSGTAFSSRCVFNDGNGVQTIAYNTGFSPSAIGIGPGLNCGGAGAAQVDATQVFHAIQMVANGASSNIYIDGTGNTCSPGTNGTAQFNMELFAQDGGGAAPWDGILQEFGWAYAAWSVAGGGTASLVSANQQAYWV